MFFQNTITDLPSFTFPPTPPLSVSIGYVYICMLTSPLVDLLFYSKADKSSTLLAPIYLQLTDVAFVHPSMKTVVVKAISDLCYETQLFHSLSFLTSAAFGIINHFLLLETLLIGLVDKIIIFSLIIFSLPSSVSYLASLPLYLSLWFYGLKSCPYTCFLF